MDPKALFEKKGMVLASILQARSLPQRFHFNYFPKAMIQVSGGLGFCLWAPENH